MIGLSDLPPTMTRFVDDGSDDGEGEVNDNAADDREADMAYQAAVDKKQFVLNQLALAWKEGKTAGNPGFEEIFQQVSSAAEIQICGKSSVWKNPGKRSCKRAGRISESDNREIYCVCRAKSCWRK